MVGFFEKAESIEGVESRKLTFNIDGKDNHDVACWETAALAGFVRQMKVGSFYYIECLGKTKFKNGRGWSFKVVELDTPQEQAAAQKTHGAILLAERDEMQSEASRTDAAPKF